MNNIDFNPPNYRYVKRESEYRSIQKKEQWTNQKIVFVKLSDVTPYYLISI
mgnify:CR=1 FL=1